MYYHCQYQRSCRKRCYIRCPSKINTEYDLYLCNVDHKHELNEKIKLSKEAIIQAKKMIDLNIKNNQIIEEMANLGFTITSRQLINLKSRLKKGN